jgi:anti-sigma factor RsiW
MPDERTSMTCQDVRTTLRAYHERRLSRADDEALRAHLEGCPDCAHADAVERELTSVLEERLPQYPASLALKRRIAAGWPAPAAPRSRWFTWRPAFVSAFAAAALLIVALPVLYYELAASRGAGATQAMIAEAVNDHLRVLSSQHPLDIESGGIHQVKPWFEGRLEFAPVVPFEGDADFPLKGGAVGYFRDRKTAVLVYGHRLHPISLFVFRPEGLPWPAADGGRAVTALDRGFNLVMWRRGGLAYALVSDVDRTALATLAGRLQAPPLS